MQRKLLFLSSRNSVRSQLAEALLRHHGPQHLSVVSAGLEAGEVHPLVHTVLQERGIETAGLHPKALRDLLGFETFHFMIVLCGRDEHYPIFPGVAQRMEWPLPDPSLSEEVGRLDAFRATRDDLERRITGWLAEQAIPAREPRFSL